MAQETRLPLGLRFIPTNEELINGYLIPRILGLPLEWNRIAEKDVYSAEPWIVFSNVDDFPSSYWNTGRKGRTIEETAYVFTQVPKTTPKSKRYARRAGSGTWTGQTGPKSIVDPFTGEVIGCMRMLSFRRVEGAGPDDQNHWVMHEYSLVDAGLRAIGDRENNVVLCKITKTVKDSDRPLNQQQSLNSFPKAGNAPSLLLHLPLQPPFQPPLQPPFQPPLKPPLLPPPLVQPFFQAVLGIEVPNLLGSEQLHGESTINTAAGASSANCENSAEYPATNAEASTRNSAAFFEAPEVPKFPYELLIGRDFQEDIDRNYREYL